MAFDWMEPYVPEGRAAREAAAALAAQEREIAERASLLLRLGYGLAETQMRVRGNLLWDFELHGRPAIVARCDEIVRRVWERRLSSGR
ncbi:MAG: hypothetical protein HYY06_05035 [Deltaproteobacteria bacterium]|nr:hypothetical protein [Deltaproteobacteria bacterium]